LWGSQSWLPPAFQPALFGDRKRSPVPKKPPERRLQGKIACPTKQA
jgi:hypothetical protein